MDYNGADGRAVLTLTGVGSLADYQSVLRQVSYFNSLDEPNNQLRQISMVLDDGGRNSGNTWPDGNTRDGDGWNGLSVQLQTRLTNDAPIANNQTVEMIEDAKNHAIPVHTFAEPIL